MSRTVKGSPDFCKYEPSYGSRRPVIEGVGSRWKGITHSRERAAVKQEISCRINEMHEPDLHGMICLCDCWECMQADYEFAVKHSDHEY